MKTAVKEQEASPAGQSAAAEIPALLVAGGSCSRLCRSQRMTNQTLAAESCARPTLDSTATPAAAHK
jgi:hypothetical protein